MTPAVAGVDGCKGGWVVVQIQSGVVTATLASTFEAVAFMASSGPLYVDMPIGLPETEDRQVERLARQRLPGRTASVFNVPARSAVYADNYEQACAFNLKAQGKKISLQSWYICPKIKEVDQILQAQPGLRPRVLEAHPELLFATFSGAPMRYSKKQAAGQDERIQLLERNGLMPRSVLSTLYERTRKSAVQIDDVLDAMVLYLLGLSKPEPLLSESVIDACGLAVNYQMPASRRGASL
jgi:predicted RNase H-like nuclease|tara:strand:+ start:1691 stop:2407 length:717 start_codon:yes stop_codon:yes gene_type:complete